MYVIDRIEENQTVICEEIESGKRFKINIASLCSVAKEGDVLEVLDGQYVVNQKLTAQRRSRISGKLAKLRKH